LQENALSADGTYGFVYCGAIGLGIGVFTVRSGAVVGRDFSGASYHGTANDQPDGSIELSIATIRSDIAQDMSSQEAHRRELVHRYPPVFGEGKPIEVGMGPRAITIMIKRINDVFASAAVDGISAETAAKLAFAQADYPRGSQTGTFVLGPTDEPEPFMLHE
jgi:hypothetical protein